MAGPTRQSVESADLAHGGRGPGGDGVGQREISQRLRLTLTGPEHPSQKIGQRPALVGIDDAATYSNAQVRRGISVGVAYQLLGSPGYDGIRGAASILGLRLHVEEAIPLAAFTKSRGD